MVVYVALSSIIKQRKKNLPRTNLSRSGGTGRRAVLNKGNLVPVRFRPSEIKMKLGVMLNKVNEIIFFVIRVLMNGSIS